MGKVIISPRAQLAIGKGAVNFLRLGRKACPKRI
jgi:hypothetical protein